jgi:hypothetical protein
MPERSNFKYLPAVGYDQLAAPPRRSFIVIATTINSRGKIPVAERISAIKTAVIQHIDKTAEEAHSDDIIEAYTCQDACTFSTLIPPCEAAKATNKENRCRINDIEFRESTQSNLQTCIFTILNRMGQLSHYRCQLFLFADVLRNPSAKMILEKSITQVVNENRNAYLQLHVCPENWLSTKEPPCISGIGQNDHPVKYNNEHDNEENKNIRHHTVVLSVENDFKMEMENSGVPNNTVVDRDPGSIHVHQNIVFVGTKSLLAKAKNVTSAIRNRIRLHQQSIDRTTHPNIAAKSSATVNDFAWYLSLSKK